jgi:phosphopantothenoylcysteine decarboxylase / phosphopantothenate---cysteine ligase
MSVLKGKKILLGISGGIAAYKTASLVRLFIKAGAVVKVIMTPSAKSFITPLTLATLSKNPVLTDFLENEDTGVWNNHVELGLWADILLIAPTTASTLSKMVNGQADNFLLTTYLSAKCPIFFAPAMDLDMYKHPSTVRNLETLKSYGTFCIPAESGELASGLNGEGRMAEPETIFAAVENYFQNGSKLLSKLLSKHFLITAGPTFEPIDPVRFIGNHASGKMGFALALAAANQGAYVTLVSGPSSEKINHPNINRVDVQSSDQMFETCHHFFETCDVFIAAAAVADYKPATVSPEKIKKKDSDMSLSLVKTIDILASLSANKTKQVIVGFALETTNEHEHAEVKMKRKKTDMLVLNSLREKGAGFGFDTNKVYILKPNKPTLALPLLQKSEVALHIINEITDLL